MLFREPKIDSIEPLENPKFIKPMKINYTLNGKKKVWEAVKSHDSVSIVLWNKELQNLIVVKQFRVPVLNANKKDGMMYELCAGLVDKEKSKMQIAKEEVLEECGYDVPLQNFTHVSSFYTAVGMSGAQQSLYYAWCDESMKVSEGGGLEEEDIEVIYIPIEKAKDFIFDTKYQKTPGLMMGFYWFFDNFEELNDV